MQDRVLQLFYTPTHTPLADLLTKALNAQKLASLLIKMSISNIHGTGANLEGGRKDIKGKVRAVVKQEGSNATVKC